MTKEEFEIYLKIQEEVWCRARSIFETKIKASDRQDFEGAEVGDGILTINWSESCRGEWEDYYEHFPSELLLLDEKSCMERIDEIVSARERKRREQEEKDELLQKKIQKSEDLATMRALAEKYGYSVEEREGETR